jgi:hypothetical protein
MRETPSKTFKSVFFCEFRTLLTPPIGYAMPLANLLDGFAPATQVIGLNNLLVGIL